MELYKGPFVDTKIRFSDFMISCLCNTCMEFAERAFARRHPNVLKGSFDVEPAFPGVDNEYYIFGTVRTWQ